MRGKLSGIVNERKVIGLFVFFSLIGGADYKLIYRHYATLYFVFCVDSSESELGILDLIQVFVETLDKCFENVCELDLIFHVDKVCIHCRYMYSIKCSISILFRQHMDIGYVVYLTCMSRKIQNADTFVIHLLFIIPSERKWR